jgi:DNA helicase-2/ATP-dependent DNA helicase PcrA
MDGTLIDTEKYYRKCWPKALAHFGYHMTDEQALSMRSLGQPFAPAHLREMFGDENLDYAAIRSYRKELMEECIRENGISLKPGVRELLAFLKEHHIQSAIATATDMERTERYLKQIGLYGAFDKIVSATMVKEGKPAPDIYLYACEACGCLPEECMAVEDSPNGVLSAYRAGCRVVMVPDQTQPDEELMKHLYAKVDSLSEIEKLLI